MNGKLATALVLIPLIALSALAAACGGFDVPDSRRNWSGPGSAEDPSVAAPAAAAAPSPTAVHIEDTQAIVWLEKYCRGCHAKRKDGILNGSWPMPDTLTTEWLETTDLTAVAYELLHRKLTGTGDGQYPGPMPAVALDATETKDLRDIVGWFEERLPFSVAEADVRYGRRLPTAPRPDLHFACKNVATTRTFLRRFTSTLLDRAPTSDELNAFADVIDTPITPATRARFLKGLRGSWKTEMMSKGVAKLARSVATAGSVFYQGIAPPRGTKEPFSAVVKADLDQEFYQLVLSRYDQWDYRDFFTNNVVMTTPNTAPLYGCAAGAGWQECSLTAPRSGFFTTLGYLNLAGQSFIAGGENNSRRFSGMYQTLTGEGPPREGAAYRAADPPPDCIDTTDMRLLVNATTGETRNAGAAAILNESQNCQSCHLSIGVAAGMVLFRPFSSNGTVFSPTTFGMPGTPDAADLASSMASPWGYRPAPAAPPQPMDAAFLRSILNAPPKACVHTDDPNEPYVKVSTVGELASHFLAKQDAVARSFARHAHRAFSQAPMITLEMEVRAMQAFDAGKTTFPDLIESYVGSDSFACEEEL